LAESAAILDAAALSARAIGSWSGLNKMAHRTGPAWENCVATNRPAAAELISEPLNLPTKFAMLIGGLMVTLAMSALSPVLAKIDTALAHTADERLLVKMLIPIIGFTMVIGAPLTGYLADRISLRRILTVHSVTYAAAGMSGFFLRDLHLLLLSRLFVGIAAAGMATISMTLINTRLDGVQRAKWMGFHISAAMLGSLVIMPVVGALGELGWRWPFLAYAGGLTVTIAALSGLQEPVRRASAAENVREKPAADARNPLKWFPLWFMPLALVMGAVTYLPAIYLPFVAKDIGITSPAILSAVMLADSLLGAGMALLFGWSQRRMSSVGAFMFSFSCSGIGMLVVSQARGGPMLVVGMLIFGLGLGWFVPNLMISISRRVTQDQQGRAVGIIKAAHYLASPLGVLAVEPIARAFGPRAAMLASAVASLSVVLCFLVISAGRLRAPTRDVVPAS
jgi:MFS family permease